MNYMYMYLYMIYIYRYIFIYIYIYIYLYILYIYFISLYIYIIFSTSKVLVCRQLSIPARTDFFGARAYNSLASLWLVNKLKLGRNIFQNFQY